MDKNNFFNKGYWVFLFAASIVGLSLIIQAIRLIDSSGLITLEPKFVGVVFVSVGIALIILSAVCVYLMKIIFALIDVFVREDESPETVELREKYKEKLRAKLDN